VGRETLWLLRTDVQKSSLDAYWRLPSYAHENHLLAVNNARGTYTYCNLLIELNNAVKSVGCNTLWLLRTVLSKSSLDAYWPSPTHTLHWHYRNNERHTAAGVRRRWAAITVKAAGAAAGTAEHWC